MDRTTPSIADLTTTHAAGWYISAGPDGTEYGRGRTATDALLMAAERLDAPRYDLMLDVCAGDPEELEGPSEEGGEGGPNPDADPYISALAAHVAREYTAFLAAAPDSPAPSFHQPAPAGDAAASAAGPKAAYLERAERARAALARPSNDPRLLRPVDYGTTTVVYARGFPLACRLTDALEALWFDGRAA